MDDRKNSFQEKPRGLLSSYPNLLVFVVKESVSISPDILLLVMSFIVELLSFEPESTLKLSHVPLQPYQEILKLYPKVLLLPLLCEYSSAVLFDFDDVSPLHNSICKLGVVQWTAVLQVCEMDCFSNFTSHVE